VLRQPFAWPEHRQASAPGFWVPPSAHEQEASEGRRGKPVTHLARRRKERAVRHGEHHATPSVTSVERPLASYDPISLGEATGFAGRFAADYLSWDEDEPERRAMALRQYLADPRSAVLGWSGSGRQRAELVIPGRTVRYQGAIVVEITARVVLYERTSPAPTAMWDQSLDAGRPPIDQALPPLAAGASSAPAPSAPGWAPNATWWVSLAPPVRRHRDGRLVIDLGLDLSATS
jgi:hypothetical protein